MYNQSEIINSLPDELIQARKQGKLLLFCGAGVSTKAGLPDFKGLVAELCSTIMANTLSKRSKPKPSDSEIQKFFSLGQYDRAISLIQEEDPFKSGTLDPKIAQKNRERVISELRKRFYEKEYKSLERHRNILRLSQDANNNIRIVTTNFDDCFEQSVETLKKSEPLAFRDLNCKIYDAPMLPPARADRWSGIVKLHGTLYRDEASRDEIVLSSGDFGRAYLTERWASKFVADLFRNFHVLFIGYSINDPVLRYIVDAYSIDIYHDHSIKKAYIYLCADDAEKTTLNGTNIEILKYNKKDEKYNGFDEFIVEWEKSEPQTSIALEDRINTLCSKIPNNKNDSIRLISLLKHPVKEIAIEATKYFAKYKDKDGKPASIKWLPYLEDAGLLVAYRGTCPERLSYTEEEEKEFIIPLVSRSWQYANTRVSESGVYFSRWLQKHVDKIELINWILKKGGVMHPQLHQDIIWQLWSGNPEYKGKGQPTKFMPVLEMLTNKDLFEINITDMDVFLLEKSLKDVQEKGGTLSTEVKQKILAIFKPRLSATTKGLNEPDTWSVISKSIKENSEELNDIDIQQKYSSIFELEMPESYRQKEFIDILQKEKRMLVDFAPDSYALLKQAFDLLKLLKRGSHTYIDRPSIENHEENSNHSNWMILLDLARDSMEALLEENPKKANAFIQIMFEEGKDNNYEIFTRLALYLLKLPNSILSEDNKLDLALEYEKDWLYNWGAYKEAGDFIKTIYKDLSNENQEKINEKIILGDSSWNESDKKEKSYKDMNIFRRLHWIKTSGGKFSKQIESKYNSLYESHSWIVSDDSDVPHKKPRIISGRQLSDNIEYEEFIGFSIEEHQELLSKRDTNYDNWQDYENNSIELWSEWIQKDSSKAFDMFTSIAKDKPISPSLLEGVLEGFSRERIDLQAKSGQSNQHKRTANDWTPLWKIILKKLNDIETLKIEHKKRLQNILCRNFSKFTRCNNIKGFDYKLFTEVFKKLATLLDEHEHEDNIENKDIDDQFSRAINHPSGDLTEALFTYMWAYGEGKEISNPELFTPYFNLLIDGNKTFNHFSRLILASHLYNVNIFLPKWTNEKLIPLFNFDNHNNALEYWGAYTHNPIISKLLAPKLKIPVIQVFEKVERLNGFNKDTIRSNFVSMVSIMIVGKDFNKKEAKNIVSKMSPEDVASICSYFERDIESETDRNKKYKCWLDLENFITSYCNKKQANHSRTSYRIAEAVLNLGDDCTKAWSKIKPFVGYIGDNLSSFYIGLIPERKSFHGDAIWEHPEIILDIVNTVTSDEPLRYAMDSLLKILDVSIQKDSALKESESYKRLLNIQKKFE